MAPLPRILALCGYSHNASIFSKQARKALLDNAGTWAALPAAAQAIQPKPVQAPLGTVTATGPAAEIVFIDPALTLTREQLMPFHVKDLEKYEKAATGPQDSVPRTWWTVPDKKTYAQYDTTVKHLHSYLTANGPFDGVIGFSQGGAMAVALAALLENPGLHPDFTAHDNLKPLKFAISVGGFKPRAENPDFSKYFPLNTPVLHVLGRKDQVVSERASKQLVDACPNSLVEYHEGGHQLPTSPAWRDFLGSYITTLSGGGKAADVAPLQTEASL